MHVNMFIIRYLKRLPWNVPDEELSLFSSFSIGTCYTATGHIDWRFSRFSESLLKSAETGPEWGHGILLSHRFQFILVINQYFGKYLVNEPTGNDENVLVI